MPLPVAGGSKGFDEDTLTRLLTSRRTAALLGWNPFMHTPKLRSRLRRIDSPTLVVWGESDRLVAPGYGRAFADAIPIARFALIQNAGHYPYLEQPADFVNTLEAFLSQAA
jgi:pimeloyl-ACP methyl ester carboxylesterase